MVAKGPYARIFSQENVLQQIFMAVIIPSLKLRADDIELFEMNGIDYVRYATPASMASVNAQCHSGVTRRAQIQTPGDGQRLISSVHWQINFQMRSLECARHI